MSASGAAVVAGANTGLDAQSRRILRYAVGATLAMALAMALDWQLAFLTPVLTLSFLASPTGPPTFKQGVAFVAMIAAASLAGILLTSLVAHYPLVYVPFIGLLLFRLFYALGSGRSPLLIVWLLIAILMIPLMSLDSQALPSLIARGLVTGAAATMIVVWLAYTLFPDRSPAVAPSSKPAKPLPPVSVRMRQATITTLAVFPAVVAYYLFQWTDAALALIMIALLSIQPAFTKDFKAGRALIRGNLMGGILAILFYELLVLVPQYSLLVMVTLLAGLVLGSRLFSDRPTASMYGMAFSTMLLVIGSTTSSSSGDAGAKVYTRIIQLMMAVVYLVVAFGLIDRLWPRQET